MIGDYTEQDARETEQDERDAAMDAAEFNDPREQDRRAAESDLRDEYSSREYDEYDYADDEDREA